LSPTLDVLQSILWNHESAKLKLLHWPWIFFPLFFGILITLCSLLLVADNAVINGNFEEGPWMLHNVSLGVLLPNNLDAETSALPGWTVESNRAVRYVDSYHYSVPEGKRAVELLSGKEGIISQMVETSPEKHYTLTFLVGAAGDLCQLPLAITAFAGNQAMNIHYAPTANLTYQSANLSFTARAERTRIAFYSVYYNTRTDDHSSLCGPVVDNVRVWAATGAAPGQLGGGLLLVGMVVYMVLNSCFGM
jgi:hypothetical protein